MRRPLDWSIRLAHTPHTWLLLGCISMIVAGTLMCHQYNLAAIFTVLLGFLFLYLDAKREEFGDRARAKRDGFARRLGEPLDNVD